MPSVTNDGLVRHAGALACARTGWRLPGCRAPTGLAVCPPAAHQGLAARSPCRARRAGRPCMPLV